MNQFNENISELIISGGFYVLRDKATGMALNSSFSREGLKWSTDRLGRLIYYPKARLVSDIIDGKHVVEIRGDLTPSKRVYIELFKPKSQPSARAQVAEFQWSHKALKLMYYVQEDSQETGNSLDPEVTGIDTD